MASDFVTIPDQLAVDAMTYLAHSEDMPIVSGESAAGGLGMLLATEVDAELRTALGLDVGSSIVLFGGEGYRFPAYTRNSPASRRAASSPCNRERSAGPSRTPIEPT